MNKDFLYFQKDLDSIQNIQLTEPIIKDNDLIGIQILSRSMNQEQVALFNLPITGANNNKQGYLVGTNGNVDLPVIGNIKAAGLTKAQLQSSLKEKLSSYVKDPSVFVSFLQFNINVLGEVKSPGTHSFDKDKVTIIDAIGAAGDLTDYGRRNDVIVIREEGKIRRYYHIDLRSGTLFQSPVYQLQPNDIVYVNASNKKLTTLEANPDSQKGWQLLIGITSVISTLVTLIITIAKN